VFASGAGSLVSGLLTWTPDSAQYGPETAAWQLAAQSIFVPVGALLWLFADPLAAWVFPESAPLDGGPDRADLYAFGFVLVGLFLLSDALTQGVYWVVVWRSARDTNFWDAAKGMSDDNSVVYWVSARAQVGAVAAKLVIGTLFLAGPRRLSAGLGRIRRELSGGLDEVEEATSEMGARDEDV
jgi:hypothetical protein